jgi:glycosyltransferase involved in cell wall biosynthesis
MTALKILLITTDDSLFEEGSDAALRINKYAEELEELHIVVITGSKVKDIQRGKNVWIYSSNFSMKLLAADSAAKLGEKIIYDHKFVRGKSVIVATDPFDCGQAGVAVKKRWKLPLEVEFSINPSANLGFRQSRQLVEVLKHADTLRVPSADVATKVVEKFRFDKQHVAVIPPYVDVRAIEGEKTSFDIHARYNWKFIMLASAARSSSDKNFAMAVDVLAKVRKFYPDTGLLVLGADDEEGSLKSQAKKLDVLGGVAFVGRMAESSSYYRTADLFIQTSTFEAYGEELIEAGAAGLPVVTTPVGVARELENGKEAIICPPDDAEYMFKAVYDLIENNSLRELLRHNLKNALEKRLSTEESVINSLKEIWLKTAAMVSAE